MVLRPKPKCLKVKEDEAGGRLRLRRSALHPAVFAIVGLRVGDFAYRILALIVPHT